MESCLYFFAGLLVGGLATPFIIRRAIKDAYAKGKKELDDHAEKVRQEIEMYANAMRRRL